MIGSVDATVPQQTAMRDYSSTNRIDGLDVMNEAKSNMAWTARLLAGALCGVAVLGLSGVAAAQSVPAAVPDGGAAGDQPQGPRMLAPPPPPSVNSEPAHPDPHDLEGTWISTHVVEVGDPSKGPNGSDGVIGVQSGKASPPGGGAPRPTGDSGATPYTPKAAARQRYKQEMNAKGTPIAELPARCRPSPALGIGVDLFPAEIIQNKDTVVVLQEELRGRWVIHLNVPQPANLTPTYRGHSVGHWEGDTLVVDTTGFNGAVDTLSRQARVTSRLRKLDGGRLLELTNVTEDPETYTRPVTSTVVSRWNPDLQVLEFQCEENLEGALEGQVVEDHRPR